MMSKLWRETLNSAWLLFGCLQVTWAECSKAGGGVNGYFSSSLIRLLYSSTATRLYGRKPTVAGNPLKNKNGRVSLETRPFTKPPTTNS